MQTPSFSRRLIRHSLFRRWGLVALALLGLLIISPPAAAQVLAASEANLVLPDLSTQTFLGINGWWLLTLGMIICFAGLAFGIVIYKQLRELPVHKAMLEVSETIYATCKTYLFT